MIFRTTSFWVFLLSSIITAAILFVLNHPWIPLAPIGSLINPYTGLWRHRSLSDRAFNADEKSKDHSVSGESLKLDGVKGPVQIQYDSDGVPHIFASTDEDLYFTQGFVVARDRLWQMDFLSRVAAGRLSEVIGAKTIPVDTMMVEMGIPQAAKESLELMMTDPPSRTALEAYARGVNVYISHLKPSQYPFEYKLFAYSPELWTPLKTALLIKFMAFHLSGYSRDLLLTRSRLRLNEIDFKELFPLRDELSEPIIPKEKTWNFKARVNDHVGEEFHSSIDLIQTAPTPHPGNGSNNWAVGPSKSTTGYPIVCNDVHLEYSLPSLWYEMQLHSPTHNVMGASLPGAPGIVIGFNDKFAWGVTNAGTDVMDWYELRFRDANHREYLHDGDWRPVLSQEHDIQVRGQKSVTLTLRRTHYGPIPYSDNDQPMLAYIPKGVALRWAALDPSNELKSFLGLNHAHTLKDCFDTLAGYSSPGQNFVCADVKGNIGIIHNAKTPIRWPGQGRMIGDGTDRTYDWNGWIPHEEMPMIINPPRGFVSSANQQPAGANYPHYLGWRFEAPYRGMRINEILRSKKKFSPDDMREMQKDVLSIPARTLVPVLLKTVSRENLSDREKKILEILSKWDFKHTKDSAGAVIWMEWWRELELGIWGDKFPDPQLFLYPQMQKTIDLIMHEPNSKWFDRRDTDRVETLVDVVDSSFAKAEATLVDKLGKDPSRWRWAVYQPTTLLHLSRMPGLGVKNLEVAGESQTIFANTGKHGPDWKMVVALGPHPKAWAIYPGGQTGDPTSKQYNKFVSDWSVSALRELHFYQDLNDRNAGVVSTVQIEAQ